MRDPWLHHDTLHHILSLPSALSSRNRDSLLHATRYQSSTLQSLCPLVQARRVARWRALSDDTLVGRWFPKSIWRRERCTVCLLTLRLAPSFNWVIIRPEVRLSWLRTKRHLSPSAVKANCHLQFAR
ncbi:hypothetical protein TNCV_1088121 [Trichonephila clavipes]|uniref:Uncharacterized protein n=1 Tax=Trichonephila clavipes TaxID=2585209 RepID=A0A8X6SP56_TRICX|nr:hypothetical protein TNCV_1088121 [Trichonephila clavipes]